MRNTLDAKRAELILRAVNIAVRNARHVKFDSEVYPKVREVPEYAEPETDDVGTIAHVGKTAHVETGAIARPASKASEVVTEPNVVDEYLPAVAAVPYKPVDPRDPHFLERFEEGGRVLAREAAERRAAEARAASETAGKEDNRRIDGRDASTAAQPSGCSSAGNTTVDPTKRKPPVSVKAKTVTAQSVTAQRKYAAAPKERKSAAQRVRAG